MNRHMRTVGIVLVVIGLINLLHIPILTGLVSQILNVLLLVLGICLIIKNN